MHESWHTYGGVMSRIFMSHGTNLSSLRLTVSSILATKCVAVRCRALQGVAVCCSVLQCVAVCCSVLQRVALCCSVLQCVAVCYSVLQCVAVCCCVLQYAALCCSLLQCAGVWCSVLQCVAVCCSMMHLSGRQQQQRGDLRYRRHPAMFECDCMCESALAPSFQTPVGVS